MKIEDLMWEQAQAHSSEVDELRNALEEAVEKKAPA